MVHAKNLRKTSLRAVMRTAAEYRKKLGHSKSAALREAWAYCRSYEPKTRRNPKTNWTPLLVLAGIFGVAYLLNRR